LSGSYTGVTGVGTLTAGTWNATAINAVYGGTGITSYSVGDIVYADTTTSLAKLADVAVGNALISGGVAAAPSWGKIGLATHVSGTLPIANGGTNSTATPTNGGVVYGTGTAQAYSTAGTSGQVLTSAGAAAPTWTTATNANTASAIVQRDGSGNFSAGTITAALSGNASTSSTATSANGLSGINSNISSAVQTGTISSMLAQDTNASLYRYTAGAVAAFITGQAINTTGNAATATVLQTARTIGGVSFNGSANINLPGVNAAGNQNTTGSSGSCTGNAATATALSSGQSNWSGTGVLGNVVGLMAWKNYGNSHVIFDASNSTSPSGGAVNNTNSSVAWSATYPTLMGWNGSSTYGVRVDSARISNLSDRAPTYFYIDQNYGYSVVGLYTSTIFQGVFAMGDAYKTTAGGGISNLYGMTWSYPSAGGIAGNLSSHGMIVAINGGFGSCMSYNVTASANVTAYSDERLKKNWEPLCDNFVEKLAGVKVGTYERIDQPIVQVGVSAQSLEKVLPEAVTTGSDDMQTKHVAYGNAALASAVMLAQEIVELKKMMKQMQEEIAELKRGA
jgi:hypothetical protein